MKKYKCEWGSPIDIERLKKISQGYQEPYSLPEYTIYANRLRQDDYIPSRSIKPFDTNFNRPISPNKAQISNTDSYITPAEETQSKGAQLGQNLANVGRQAGQIVNQALTLGIPALANLIPDNNNRNPEYQPPIYNPYAFGNGSQAIYEDGGEIEAKSGIYINPKNKGKFNALKKKTGKTTEELTHSKNPLTRKRAVFAMNAKHWRKGEDGLELLGDGEVQPIGYNPYTGDTLQFNGNSHEQGGIPIDYNGQQVEVEGGESGFSDNNNNFVVFGNMKVPGKSITFKNEAKNIAKKEQKANKTIDKAGALMNDSSEYNKFNALSINSAQVMLDAASQNLKSAAQQKDSLANIQNAILSYADQTGKSPKVAAKEFRKGGKIGVSYDDGKTWNYHTQPFTDYITPKEAVSPIKKKTNSNKSITFEALRNKEGVITDYSPIFHNFNYNEANNAFSQLPLDFNGIPVINNQYIYSELTPNFNHGTNSEDWIHMNNGGKIYNPNLATSNKDFQNWYYSNTPEGKNRIPYSNNGDYDYFSYYMNGDYKNYKGGHFPDTYKKPNHETFSNESIYSTPENPGGSWNGDQFIPMRQGVKSWGSKFGEYKDGGMIKAKDGKTLAERNNNPGNLKYIGQKGATKGDKGFAKFDSYETGYQALLNDLKAKQSGKSKTGLKPTSTLQDLINIYAPSTDNNNPTAYANTVASNLGVNINTPISKLDTDKLAKSIAAVEDIAYATKMNSNKFGQNAKLGPNQDALFVDHNYQDDPVEPFQKDQLTPLTPIGLEQGQTPYMERNIPYRDLQGNPVPEGQNPYPQYIPKQREKFSLADSNKLNPLDFLSEIGAAFDKPDFVPKQVYNPTLYQPYQVSFQDRLNENNASFRSIGSQLVNNPEALSILAGQKYQQDSAVLADQFRTNQSIANDIINKNVSIINDAELKNIQLADTQQERMAQNKGITNARRDQAFASISNKIAQNRLQNNNIKMLESQSLYRYNPETGETEYIGGQAPLNLYGNLPNQSRNTARTVKRDSQGNIISSTEYTPTEVQQNKAFWDAEEKRIKALNARKATNSFLK